MNPWDKRLNYGIANDRAALDDILAGFLQGLVRMDAT
jgi:hypothetical protein